MALVAALGMACALCAAVTLVCVAVSVAFTGAFLTTVHRRRRRAQVALGRQADPAPSAASDLTAAGPPLEEIAEEIHRLVHSRATSAPGTLRHVAATRAYDRRLVQACRALRITEHLLELRDLDLELERLRVETTLAAEGFVLDTDASRPA